VSSFLVTLDVPWPKVFITFLSRVSVINLNLMRLPKAACMNPSPSFYRQFNGYTLGLVAAMLALGALWLIGAKLVAPFTLAGMTPAERQERSSSFNSTILQRLLLVLYLVYPGAQAC
jgi:hypothetical protein